MPAPLDHIIFVGFAEPDLSTQGGQNAYQHIMDVANVHKDNIHFYSGDADIKEVIRSTFPFDKAAKHNYRIGNSVCIISESVEDRRRLQLERMTKIEVKVRSGYDDVDLSTMSEAETAYWIDTSNYKKIEASIESSGDIVEDLLGDSSTDDQIDAILEGEESLRDEYYEGAMKPPSEDLEFRSSFEDAPENEVEFDDMMDGIDSTVTGIKKDGLDLDVDSFFDEEDDEELSGSTAISSFDDEDDDEEINYAEEFDVNRFPTERAKRDGKTEEELNLEIREELERERRKELDQLDGIKHDDSQDLVNAFERENRQAERRHAIQDIRRTNDNEDALAADREMMDRDRFGESSSTMNRRAGAQVESKYREDGKLKNYRDYLPEEAASYQEIAERTRAKFGDIKNDSYAAHEDNRYVPEGRGKIILVTSGKGGVGKSLVANGLAMALSLARAKESQTNTAASQARTFLIESDYNSPQLAVAFKTGTKHIGNIADRLSSGKRNISNEEVRYVIEENIHYDTATGINVLACPPLASRKSSREIPYAILVAVKYASEQGHDVIIDHGNLTSGVHSELDQVLSMQLASQVVMVCNMGCIPETWSALDILTNRDRNSVVAARPVNTVGVVLNSARREQFLPAQDMLRPFDILNILPPIDDFRAENSLHGSTYLPDAPKGIQKAVMDRCGIVLTKIGFPEVAKYYSHNPASAAPAQEQRKGFLRKISSMLARD